MRIKHLALAMLASATVMLGACAESTDGQATAALYPGHRRTACFRLRSHRDRVGWHLARHPFS
jgi:hypothetical protein